MASPLAEFLAIVNKLPPQPSRLLLILFEYRWAVQLYGERKLLAKAIDAMERALRLRKRRRGYSGKEILDPTRTRRLRKRPGGYSVKDMDALEEIGYLIEHDREKRRDQAHREKATRSAVQGAAEVELLPRERLIAYWEATVGVSNIERARKICRKHGIEVDKSESLCRRIRRLRAKGVPLSDASSPKKLRTKVNQP